MGAGKDNGSDILTDTVVFFGESNAAEVDDVIVSLSLVANNILFKHSMPG